jgi:hypothetical protein
MQSAGMLVPTWAAHQSKVHTWQTPSEPGAPYGCLVVALLALNSLTWPACCSGYTAKVAGTEVGVVEPEATFSACFGSAFLVRAGACLSCHVLRLTTCWPNLVAGALTLTAGCS